MLHFLLRLDVRRQIYVIYIYGVFYKLMSQYIESLTMGIGLRLANFVHRNRFYCIHTF
jgi:hypothetical protein